MTLQRLTSTILIRLLDRLAPGYVGTEEETDTLVAGINEAIREMACDLGLTA